MAPMRILYGVNGEGMGHATRSRVVIDHLLDDHDVRVVASGAAFAYLRECCPRVDEIFGPTFAMEEGQIQRWATVVQNLRKARRELPETVHDWMAHGRRVAAGGRDHRLRAARRASTRARPARR